MFVMTVDQQGSRRDVDRVEHLLTALPHSARLLRAFERTAGDEVQGVTDDSRVVVDLVVALLEDGHWSIGVGIGSVESPLPEVTRAGRGRAFEAARSAVTRAKNTAAGLAVDAPSSRGADAETVLTLLAMVVARRSEPGRAAVALMREGANQSVAADTLGITKQAVSQRLAAAGWHIEGPARDLAARLLEEADSE